MKKWYQWLMMVASVVLVLAGCGRNDTSENTASSSESKAQPFAGKTLNVIATSDKYVDLFNKFTEQTGAKVEFLSMSSGEVISRTKAEGKPMADVWFGGGLDAFLAADEDGLLEHYTSPNASAVNEAYKGKDGAWIAKGLTVAGFLVNNKVLEEKGLPIPKTWDDLTKPEYKGLIIMSNPAISGTNYAVVKGLLDAKGETNGWQYFEKLNENIDFYSKRGKDPQEKTVQGEFAIGIIPVDNSAFEVAKDNDLTVVYPDIIPWVPEGVAIFKGSENVEVAKAFEDFMLTKEAQEIIAKVDGKDTAQIVVPDVKGLSLGLPEDKLIKENLSDFGSNRDDILAHFKQIAADKAEE
ncbi:MAG: extracellular solute-binding protein [Aerococcus sp.]|nr:extracellular solute-binding protein [Aerococcus sp.]